MLNRSKKTYEGGRIRVLHSFPHRLGMGRICTTAWYEIESVADAGANMLVMAGDSVRPFGRSIQVHKTFSMGRLRLPYRLLGARKMCMLHDHIVARMLPRIANSIDIIHAWPLAALKTIKVARSLGIPVALERCNAHTRLAYDVVKAECDRIGVPLPKGHEHAYNPNILKREEAEYEVANALLCPSEFTLQSFRQYGIPRDRLVRFIYGVDEKRFFPGAVTRPKGAGLRMIFVGVCAVRKGLHFALEAWLNSEASRVGEFWIAGDFIPAYREKLGNMLDHKSIKILGHRNDIPELMRSCDLFIMPSIEEGFGLVCTEAMASGCVPIVSNACTELCQNMENSMVHNVGDVETLTSQITRLHFERNLLGELRENGIKAIPSITWSAAGRSLLAAYEKILMMN